MTYRDPKRTLSTDEQKVIDKADRDGTLYIVEEGMALIGMTEDDQMLRCEISPQSRGRNFLEMEAAPLAADLDSKPTRR